MKVQIHRAAIAFVLASLISTSALASTKNQNTTNNVKEEENTYIINSLKKKGYKFVPNQQLSFKKINVFQDDQDNEDNVTPTTGSGYDIENNSINLKLNKGQSGTYYEDNSTNSDRITALEAGPKWSSSVFLSIVTGLTGYVSPYGDKVLGNVVSNNSSDFTDSKYKEANTAMDQFQKNQDYFKNKFNWDSFDNGKGVLKNKIIDLDVFGKITSSDPIDYSFNSANLYLNNSKTSLTLLGAGGNIEYPAGTVKYVFKPFATDRAIIAHEYSHGVVRSIANFGQDMESSGLNEGLPDVFAAAITGEWAICSKMTNVASDNSSFIRDLSNPSKYTIPNDPKTPYPSKYSDLNDSTADGHNAGTVIGHQFYLMSEGGNYNDKDITGIGRDEAAKIVFNSLSKLPDDPNFADYRNAMEKTATELYGSNSKEYNAVVDSMNATEMPMVE